MSILKKLGVYNSTSLKVALRTLNLIWSEAVTPELKKEEQEGGGGGE